MAVTIRNEVKSDIDTISNLTKAAFKSAKKSTGTEHFIINALRIRNELTLSLVAVEDSAVVGHVAISPVSLSTGESGWHGLGPISVWPEHQGRGIGSALIKAALLNLKIQGSLGCVVLGNPEYYGRFGFKSYHELELPGVPCQFFQALVLGGALPTGTVQYSEAFNATQ